MASRRRWRKATRALGEKTMKVKGVRRDKEHSPAPAVRCGSVTASSFGKEGHDTPNATDLFILGLCSRITQGLAVAAPDCFRLSRTPASEDHVQKGLAAQQASGDVIFNSAHQLSHSRVYTLLVARLDQLLKNQVPNTLLTLSAKGAPHKQTSEAQRGTGCLMSTGTKGRPHTAAASIAVTSGSPSSTHKTSGPPSVLAPRASSIAAASVPTRAASSRKVKGVTRHESSAAWGACRLSAKFSRATSSGHPRTTRRKTSATEASGGGHKRRQEWKLLRGCQAASCASTSSASGPFAMQELERKGVVDGKIGCHETKGHPG
eukprot:scaffold880_cov384-Prasinococcus_capsulatus_cf.AAC.14